MRARTKTLCPIGSLSRDSLFNMMHTNKNAPHEFVTFGRKTQRNVHAKTRLRSKAGRCLRFSITLENPDIFYLCFARTLYPPRADCITLRTQYSSLYSSLCASLCTLGAPYFAHGSRSLIPHSPISEPSAGYNMPSPRSRMMIKTAGIKKLTTGFHALFTRIFFAPVLTSSLKLSNFHTKMV